MAVTHSWQTSVKPSGLPSMPTDAAVVITGDFSVDVEETVAAGASKIVYTGTIDHTKTVSFVLHSAQSNVTVTTGSQTVPLGTAKAEGWNSSMTSVANPLSGDITTLTVDNTAGTKDTLFRASFLQLA
jgi:hypothetical protein